MSHGAKKALKRDRRSTGPPSSRRPPPRLHGRIVLSKQQTPPRSRPLRERSSARPPGSGPTLPAPHARPGSPDQGVAAEARPALARAPAVIDGCPPPKRQRQAVVAVIGPSPF